MIGWPLQSTELTQYVVEESHAVSDLQVPEVSHLQGS